MLAREPDKGPDPRLQRDKIHQLEKAQTKINLDLDGLIKDEVSRKVFTEIMENVIDDMLFKIAERRVDPNRVTNVRKTPP